MRLEFALYTPPELERADDASASTGDDGRGNTIADGAPANSGAASPQRLVIESPSTTRTGFLGLSDDDTPRDDDAEPEPEAPSHRWRNIAISVVAVVLVLTAMQWRAIRDYNLRRHNLASVQGAAKQESSPPASAVAADGTGRIPGVPPAAAQADAPKVVANSTEHTRPAQPTGNSLKSASPAVDSIRSANPVSPRSMGARATDILESQPPAISKASAQPRSTRPAASLSGAGTYEMSRAAHASDAQARAGWLWNAVAKGNPQASVELAKLYEEGSGVARNCDQARILLRSAAQKGNEQAKLNLQQIYRQGGCAPR